MFDSIYKIRFNIINGLIHAIINKPIPMKVTSLSSSIIPAIRSIIPKNPKTAGKICENINVPVAILSQ